MMDNCFEFFVYLNIWVNFTPYVTVHLHRCGILQMFGSSFQVIVKFRIAAKEIIPKNR